MRFSLFAVAQGQYGIEKADDEILVLAKNLLERQVGSQVQVSHIDAWF